MPPAFRTLPPVSAVVVVGFLLGCGRSGAKTSSAALSAASRKAVAPAVTLSASAVAAPALPKAEVERYKLRPSEGDDPLHFEHPHAAQVAAAAAVAPKAAPPADGCKRALVAEMQGYLEEAPIRGTLELRGARASLRIFNVKTRARQTLQGTLQPSMCENAELTQPGGISLRPSPGSTAARYEASLIRNSYFDVDRNRLRLEATEADASYPTLELWETYGAQIASRDKYQAVLMRSVDVEAVVPGNDGTTYLAYLTVKERALGLAELKGSPPKLTREIVTGISCDLHECGADLEVFSVNPNLTVLVPTLSGENCGAKCTRSARGEVWALTEDGFHEGAHLPDGFEITGGITYPGSSNQTTVSWVDGDGVAPLEMLVESSSTDDEKVSRTVLGYDPATQAYSISSALGEMPREAVDPLKRGPIVSY